MAPATASGGTNEHLVRRKRIELVFKMSAGEKMSRKQSILIFVAVSLLFSLLFFIIFSDQGLVDLNTLKKERDQLAEKNELLNHENLTLSDEIDRLQNDPKYIENIARQELGMVGRDELILKPQSSPKHSSLH